MTLSGRYERRPERLLMTLSGTADRLVVSNLIARLTGLDRPSFRLPPRSGRCCRNTAV